MQNKKTRLEELFEENKPEILAASITAGACLLTLFYTIGVRKGKRIVGHGPCIEVGRKGADALLAGKSINVMLDGRDVLYKILPD